jgi:hypothetical protein
MSTDFVSCFSELLWFYFCLFAAPPVNSTTVSGFTSSAALTEFLVCFWLIIG